MEIPNLPIHAVLQSNMSFFNVKGEFLEKGVVRKIAPGVVHHACIPSVAAIYSLFIEIALGNPFDQLL